MPKFALIALGTVMLLAVTFANPVEGNVFGFCPISKGPRAIGHDVIVATIDVVAVWLIYRGIRR